MSTVAFAVALSQDGVKYLAASPETMLAPGVPTGVANDKCCSSTDSTGPDGAQEYAALDARGQFESITFSWMNVEKAVEYIVALLTEPRTYLVEGVSARTDHQARFGGSCSLCA